MVYLMGTPCCKLEPTIGEDVLDVYGNSGCWLTCPKCWKRYTRDDLVRCRPNIKLEPKAKLPR